MNGDQLLQVLFNTLIILGITITLFFIVFVIWNIILLPIKKKNEIDKELDDKRIELQKINLETENSYKTYLKLVDDNELLRKEHFSKAERVKELEKQLAKLELEKKQLNLKLNLSTKMTATEAKNTKKTDKKGD